MAKKKEAELSYLQMPLPGGRKYYKMTKRAWSGLNRRQVIDTGALSAEYNISTMETPYLTPSQKRAVWRGGYTHPISLFGFDDFLMVAYYQETDSCINIDYLVSKSKKYTAKVADVVAVTTYARLPDTPEDAAYYYVKDEDAFYTYRADWEPINPVSSVVQFNVYDAPTDPVDGEYIKKLLIFPDKKSMYMHIVEADTDPTGWDDKTIAAARRDVLYNYKTLYYTVDLNDDGDRYVKQSGGSGYFLPNDMDVTIKTYYNSTSEKDKSGATIYPPSESADTNYYYKNTYNQDVYKYCAYETEDGSTVYGWKVSATPAMPDIKYATVYLSRLFGVDDDRVYASGYNDYTSWNLDTIDEYNESNAWCSPAQSNTKAGGAFTGITTFQGHVVCFKRDFMHELYNTKNPFRIQDIYAEGAIDNRTIQDVDGRLIFVSDDDVKIYTGSNPRIIGYYLNWKQYTNAVSGTDGRNYYLYCEDVDNNRALFVYDTIAEQWSQQAVDSSVLNFAHNKNGMYMLCDNGVIYQMDTDDYQHTWWCETDLITNETVNIKHIKKLQMLADIGNGAQLKVYVLYDDEVFDEDTSHLVYTSDGTGQTTIRVKPRQTASYGIKLHIAGEGYVRLYELELFMETGGDLYV